MKTPQSKTIIYFIRGRFLSERQVLPSFLPTHRVWAISRQYSADLLLKDPEKKKKGDAYSQWKGSVPPILVNTDLDLNL